MAKILLVEDDKSLREIYGVRLLAEGYDIVSAGDGEEALAMAIKERPQLIVSDVMMPKISGFDMLDILRSTTETRDIKVIMMTALSSEDQRARGEQLGADRYLVKSQVGIEDVVRTVHEVLGDAPVNNRQNDQMFTRPTPRPTGQPPQPTSPEPTPQPTASPLPQPTAPFSTPRPAGLGDRVIHPLESKSDEAKPDVAALMDQELNSAPTNNPQPTANPFQSQAQQQPAPQPQPPTPQPVQPQAPAPEPQAPEQQQSSEQSQQQPQPTQPQPQQQQPQPPQPPQPPLTPPAPRGPVEFNGPLPMPQPTQQQPAPQQPQQPAPQPPQQYPNGQ